MDLQAQDPSYVTNVEDDKGVAAVDESSGWDASDGEFLPTKHTEINLNGSTPEGVEPPAVIIDKEDRLPDNPAAELLQYHYNFGHIPFAKLQEMAKRQVLPKQLATCNVPVCSACSYARLTKHKWQPKTAKNYSGKKATKPGEVVSADQLVSPTLGLIAQMAGFLTKKRYKYATVFVDQF